MVPAPDQTLPTSTPLPDNLARGTKVEYIVQTGDSLDIIAIRHNSTVEEIMTENEIEDANTIFVGQKLIISVNLVTQEPTLGATSTTAPQ